MKANYEKIVKLICGDNWETNEVSLDERDGGYGVAICLSQLRKPSNRLNDIADSIGCPSSLIETAYKRLLINGVLSNNSSILRDPDLLMDNASSEEDLMRSVKAWCHIAGLASGFVGIAQTRQEMSERRGVR